MILKNPTATRKWHPRPGGSTPSPVMGFKVAAMILSLMYAPPPFEVVDLVKEKSKITFMGLYYHLMLMIAAAATFAWNLTSSSAGKQTLEKDALLFKKVCNNRLLSSVFGIGFLLVPLVEGRVKRDFSKVTNQFNLGKHLMAPTARDLRDGIENSRRLARNAVKLGIDNEMHRELLARNPGNPPNPPLDIVNQFVTDPPQIPIPPSEGNRLRIENDGTTDRLPFGDGPGVFPAFPEGTRAFWEGDADASPNLWETVACPVTDVAGFLENPLSCVFGYDENSVVSASIMDVFAEITRGGDATLAITKANKDAIIPIAVDFIYQFSGLSWLELILNSVCEVLGVIDQVLGVVGAIQEVVDSLGSIGGGAAEEAGGLLGDVADFFGFRRRLTESPEETCTGHFTTCDGVDADCKTCFTTEDQMCTGCKTCFQPLTTVVEDMDGICIQTERLREFFLAPAPSIILTQTYYGALLAQYVKKIASGEVIQAIEVAKEEINTNVGDAQTAVTDAIATSKGNIFTKIENTCPAGRRLGHASVSSSSDEKKQTVADFMQSERAHEAKAFASKQGLKEEDAGKIFSKMFESISQEGDSFNEKLEEEMRKDFSNPQKMKLIEKGIEEHMNANTGMLVGKILGGAMDKQTRRLDADALKETISKLKDIKKSHLVQNHEQRKLDSSLKESCEGVIGDIKDFIKDAIGDVLHELINVSADMGVGLNSVRSNPIYQNAFEEVDDEMPDNNIAFGFVAVLDPFSPDGPLSLIMSSFISVLQTIAGYFIYGCNVFVFDPPCEELPSIKNEVLAKSIYETRDGTIFLASGCDSEFKAELEFYGPALEMVEKLLDAAAESVVEFLNIPIQVLKVIVQGVSLMFNHLGDVCKYLDGRTDGAYTSAIFENSRFTLQELACRTPFEQILQQGYGCDGIDNTCDDDKQIDECEEDIFPPEIDATDAMLWCSNKIFPTATDAVQCFSSLVSATDDCKDVELTVGASTSGEEATVEIKAVALGCGNRTVEDTTILEVTVIIDEVKLQRGYGCDGIDNNQNGFDNGISLDQAIDECDEDVFPPEIDATDAMLWCSNKIFPKATDAVQCFSSLVSAVDDCKDVELTVGSSTSGEEATVEIKAVALGCGNRTVEDTTILEVTVIIDEVKLLHGYGCDGIDNNQNGFDNGILLDQAIDECDEDIFPPEINTGEAILRCADKIFANSTDAVQCFSAPGLISAEDDCRDVELTFEDKDDAPVCSAIVEIKAVALGCGNRTVEDTTVLDAMVAIDNDPPLVSCTLGTQGLPGTGAGVFTDLAFDFTAVDGGDKCTDTEDLAVTIKVLSNEVVATGEEMVFISEPRNNTGNVLSIWAEDHTCKSASSGKCKISSPKKFREYIVVVTATDKAGNVGEGECNTIVQKPEGGRGEGEEDVVDPLFLITKLDITGGVEVDEDTDNKATLF